MTAVCAVAFVVGIAWLQQQPTLLPLPALLVVLAACAFAARFAPARRVAVVVGVCVAGFAWATWRAELRLADALALDYEERDVEVVGIVRDLPGTMSSWGGPAVRFEFEIERTEAPPGAIPHYVSLGWYSRKIQGEVQPVPRVRPGERWHLRVRLRRPRGLYNPYGFDLEPWLMERGIRATGSVRPADTNVRVDAFVASPTALVDAARARIADHIDAALADRPYAGVILALVVGDQRRLSNDDWNVYNRTGVGHLLSISGLHVTMFAALVASVAAWAWSFGARRFGWFARTTRMQFAAVAGFFAAFAYTLISGFQVPAQRTLWMLGVVALTWLTRRSSQPSSILALAALVVLVLDPWAVVSPGFWLSFIAVACLMFSGIGVERAARNGWRAKLAEASRSQLAITVLLAPITLYFFQQTSLVSPIANAIAIPVVSAIVTPVALFGGLLGAALGWHWPLLVAHAVFAPLARGLDWLASWPIASIEFGAPPLSATILATIGAIWLLAPRGVPARLAGAVLCIPMLVHGASMPRDGAFRATFLDIGQGTAVLIETATHRLLYDTGPRWSDEADAGQRVVLPHLRAIGATRLDGLVVSHNDADHSGGALSLLESREIAWMASSLDEASPIVLAARNARRCEAGQRWEWDGVRFDVLHPTASSYAQTLKTNARSCVVRVEGAHGSLLLTADIEAPQERELLDREAARLPATVLAVPHHGSLTSSTVEFIAAVDPAWAIVQAGWRNRFGHPRADVLDRYAALDIPIVRTDHDGATILHFERGGPRVERWRQREPRYWHGR